MAKWLPFAQPAKVSKERKKKREKGKERKKEEEVWLAILVLDSVSSF